MIRGFENAAKIQPLPRAKSGDFVTGQGYATRRQHPTHTNPSPTKVTSPGHTGQLTYNAGN